MNSKLKQLISLLFMACLVGVTSYFIFKDQSISTLIKTVKDVNPFYIILGLCMMFVFVGCEAMNTFSIMRALGQKVSYIKCLGFAFVGFYFLKTPYVALFAFIIFITNIIPYFGPIIGAIFPIAMTLLINPMQAI